MHDLDAVACDLDTYESIFAVALENGEVAIFNSSNGSLVKKTEAHQGSALKVRFSYNGEFLASSGEDGFLRIFETNSLDLLFENKVGSVWADCLAWSPKHNFVVVSAGKAVIGVDANSKSLVEYPLQTSSVSAIDWLNETTFGLGIYGGLRIYRVSGNKEVRSYDWKGSIVSTLFSPLGNYVACGAQDNSIHIWHLKSGKDFQMTGFTAKSRELSFHHSGNWMANASGNNITIWEFSNGGPAGKSPLVLGPTIDVITRLQYQRNGDLIFSGDRGGALLVWSPRESKSPLAVAGVLDQAVTCARWASDDKAILSALKGGCLLSYSVPTI